MLQAHEPCKSLLRKHPIDSDANFQVEVEAHGDKNLMNDGQYNYFHVLKCHGKFDCLFYEMLFIKELRPSLNTQSDYISAKLFV